MARKASPVKVEPMPEINQETYQEEASALTMLGDIAQGMHEERDLVNQLLGQAQMADALSQFSRTVRLTKLAYVRENKLYRALAGKKMPNGSALKGRGKSSAHYLDTPGQSRFGSSEPPHFRRRSPGIHVPYGHRLPRAAPVAKAAR